MGVGGSSGSSGNGAPGGGERRSTRPLNGLTNSSSSVEGGGNGRGDGLFGVLRGLAAIAPVARRTGLHGGLAKGGCARCTSRPSAASVSLPFRSISGFCCESISAKKPSASDATGASLDSRVLEAFLRSRMSGLDRARLALVGDANDGICRLVDRLTDPSEGGAEPSIGTLVVGEVFRRFEAEGSIELLEFSLLSNHCAFYHLSTS